MKQRRLCASWVVAVRCGVAGGRCGSLCIVGLATLLGPRGPQTLGPGMACPRPPPPPPSEVSQAQRPVLGVGAAHRGGASARCNLVGTAASCTAPLWVREIALQCAESGVRNPRYTCQKCTWGALQSRGSDEGALQLARHLSKLHCTLVAPRDCIPHCKNAWSGTQGPSQGLWGSPFFRARSAVVVTDGTKLCMAGGVAGIATRRENPSPPNSAPSVTKRWG